MAVQDLKIFGIGLFLNISNLSIPLNSIYPKIRITNLDEHTLLYICVPFADRDVMYDPKHDLAWPLQLSKASVDVKCVVEDFELFLFPCLWITVFDPVSHIAPTGPNTFLNRYNLTLRWSWHLSMVLIDVKYVAEDWITSRVFQPMVKSIWAQFLQNCHNAQNAKKTNRAQPCDGFKNLSKDLFKGESWSWRFWITFHVSQLRLLGFPKLPYCPKYPRTDENPKEPCPWIKTSFDLAYRVKDFGLFCLCSSLRFVVFRSSFSKLYHVPNTLK